MMDGYRRITVSFLCLALVTGSLLAQQQAPPGLVLQLMKAAGTLRGEGKSYKVHELTLPQPVTVTIGDKTITTDKAWRLTITGTFVARAMPAVIEIDGVAAGVALESADQKELRLVTFDPAALHQGARVAVAYGEIRTQLPETLNLNR